MRFIRNLSVSEAIFTPMKVFEDVATVVGYALATLLVFNLTPDFIGVKHGDAIFQYSLTAVITFYIIRAHQMSSYRFFRLPEKSLVSAIALTLAAIYGFMRIQTNHPVSLSLSAKLIGLLYLLMIGIGEEFVARGFIFSVIEKYGTKLAIFGSSLTFGLMHLNLYLGKYWNPQDAYYHVLGAFGFGIFACAVMSATKSIWVVVAMHAVGDWKVVFSKTAPDGYIQPIEPWDPLWQVIQNSFGVMELPLIFSAIIFVAIWVSNRKKAPRWLERLAVRWKLVEVEDEKSNEI